MSEVHQDPAGAHDLPPVMVGDVWSSTAGPLLLVLEPPVTEAGSHWLEAVPVDTRTELASEVDLLLGPSESTLGRDLRVRWADQLFVRADRLRERHGRLGNGGWQMVEAALSGVAPEDRFGSAHKKDDPRAVADDEDPSALNELRADHRAVLQAREAAFDQGFGVGLAQIRKEQRVTRAALSQDLAAQLGIPAAAPAIKGRLAELERGDVPPLGLRKRLIDALATALGMESGWLDRLRRALPESGPSPRSAPAFARLTDKPSPPGPEESSPTELIVDAVDDLFLGGSH